MGTLFVGGSSALCRKILPIVSLTFLFLTGPQSVQAQCEQTSVLQVTASDGGSRDRAGNGVAVQGTTALIGAPGHANFSDTGAVYVRKLNGTSWLQTQKLTAVDATSQASFGTSVAIDGNWAVIGATGDAQAGAAYVFRFDGTKWVQHQKLTPAGRALGELIGTSVAISGNTIVVGAYGSSVFTGRAFVYTLSGSTWGNEVVLTRSDAAAYDFFGYAVSVSGNVIAVGTYGDDEIGANSGSVYVYRLDGTWKLESKIQAPDRAAGDSFGWSVVVSGNDAFVGAPMDDDFGANSGSVYSYIYNGSSWQYTGKLRAPDAKTDDWFGSSLSISGDSLAVGAREWDGAAIDRGGAYVFSRSGSTWDTGKLILPTPPWGIDGDLFGHSIGISGTALIVGAPNADWPAMNSGYAYLFGVECSAATPDCATNTDCNDNNVCTTDTCSSGTCSNAYNTLTCNDGNACTTSDRCALGVCAGTPLNCSDGIACTIDSCVNGVCQHNSAACGCLSNADCNDNNACTTDVCSAGVCSNANNTNTCNDGSACTTSDRCTNGQCVGTAITCNDNNACTDDTCSPATGCAYTADNTNTCNDNNACTSSDRCSSGQCIGTTITCNDNKLCTDDTCNPLTGCVYTVDNTNVCSDNNSCTTADRCSSGFCVGTPVVCNDNNPCTNDSCVNGTCQYAYNTSSCNDGNACTTNDWCSNGVCLGAAVVCNDNNPCTTDSCSNGACQYVNNSNACNDGDACTSSDRCTFGACIGTPLNCSDGIACTIDACVNGVCQHDSATCGCLSNTDCNDNNVCTTDVCSSGACQHSNNTLTCNDGNPCTTSDKCSAGVCAGVPVSCNDGNPCTTDICVSGSCVFSNNTNTCNDNNACTTSDRCSGGACSGVALACDDGVACTDDYCLNGSCVYDSSGCGCTSDLDCDDNDPCTLDGCGASRVCSNTPLSNCCGNGTCESSEDFCSCPEDCTGAPAGPSCANGVCESADGEDCMTCPADCNGLQTGPTSSRFCCGNFNGQNPVPCSDSRCTAAGWECVSTSVVEACCGDGLCTTGETACMCPEDCGTAQSRELADKDCTDGKDNDCDGLVDCADPDCADASICWVCDRNGICELGEDCKSCPSDCDGQSGGRRQDRFCCGNGYWERPEGPGSICDFNP